MGRFAVLAAEAEDDGVVVGEGVHPPGPTQRDRDRVLLSDTRSRNRERFERVHVEGHPTQATIVPESVCDALEFDLTQTGSDDDVPNRNRFGRVEDSDEDPFVG